MLIHNVRYGFATNSSSTHSVVLKPRNIKISDKALKKDQFGWNNFICSSKNAKRRYLGVIAFQAFRHVYNLPEKEALSLASEWCGTKLSEDCYIDHDSVISIPTSYRFGMYKLNRDFYNDLMAFILQDKIAILGGNDNSPPHPLLKKCEVQICKSAWEDDEIGNPALKLIYEASDKKLRARYDTKGKFWTLFNSEDGTKTRVSFGEANAEKSEVPELIDIKITNFCDQDCSYCYQGSNTKGKHADTAEIERLAWKLSEAGIFEVALGGGEPTKHPNILRIIHSFADLGITVNLTTRNEDWIIENQDRLLNKIGAIGFTIDGVYSCLDKFAKLKANIKHLNEHRGLKIVVQIPVGSCSADDLEDILKACDMFKFNVLLLGWKNTKRGKGGPRYNIDLESVLSKFFITEDDSTYWNGPILAFDTILVQQLESWLEKHSDRYLFTTKEGSHSMYIDCIRNTMHQSSYSKGAGIKFDPYTINTLSIKEFFSTI